MDTVAGAATVVAGAGEADSASAAFGLVCELTGQLEDSIGIGLGILHTVCKALFDVERESLPLPSERRGRRKVTIATFAIRATLRADDRYVESSCRGFNGESRDEKLLRSANKRLDASTKVVLRLFYRLSSYQLTVSLINMVAVPPPALITATSIYSLLGTIALLLVALLAARRILPRTATVPSKTEYLTCIWILWDRLTRLC